jgi:hypothetical protein
MRELKQPFINDLNSGILSPILKKVKENHTLMLAIRKNYINIYYRGGNLLKIEEQKGHCYKTAFDTRYNKKGMNIPDLPSKREASPYVHGVIRTKEDAAKCVDAIPMLKEIMDVNFVTNPNPECEFQQLVARENNCSTISNETEYFISDIESSESGKRARFDMLAVRWPADRRRSAKDCVPALIEMKYGDGALKGDAGLIKHLKDISDNLETLIINIKRPFEQLNELGLLKPHKDDEKKTDQKDERTRAKYDLSDFNLGKPEVIIMLANHNPRSKILKGILTGNDIKKYTDPKKNVFDLKFFIASFAGYGMHTANMHTLDEILSGKYHRPPFNQ